MRTFEFVLNGETYIVQADGEGEAYSKLSRMMTPGVMYKFSYRELYDDHKSATLSLAVEHYEEDSQILALRKLGPDVGEPSDAKTVYRIDEDLERRVMERILRYPNSHIWDGKVKGLAACAAIREVERWIIEKGGDR